MSFDVFLIPSTASPMGPAALAALDRGLAACGARRGREGEDDIVLANGEGCEFFEPDDADAGGMFALRGLSPEVAQMIFQVADATSCFVIAPSEAPALLRTPHNIGAPPVGDADAPVARVANAEALAECLRGGLGDISEPLADFDDDDDDPEIDPTLLDRFFKPSK